MRYDLHLSGEKLHLSSQSKIAPLSVLDELRGIARFAVSIYFVKTSGLLLAVGVPVLPTALQLISNVDGETSVSIS